MKVVVLFEKRRDKWATAVAVRRVLLSFLCSFDGNKSTLMCASFLYINHSHNIELVQQTYRAHSYEAWELAELRPLCRKEIIETALLSNGCCSSMGPSSVSRRSVRDGVVNGRRLVPSVKRAAELSTCHSGSRRRHRYVREAVSSSLTGRPLSISGHAGKCVC